MQHTKEVENHAQQTQQKAKRSICFGKKQQPILEKCYKHCQVGIKSTIPALAAIVYSTSRRIKTQTIHHQLPDIQPSKICLPIVSTNQIHKP